MLSLVRERLGTVVNTQAPTSDVEGVHFRGSVHGVGVNGRRVGSKLAESPGVIDEYQQRCYLF